MNGGRAMLLVCAAVSAATAQPVYHSAVYPSAPLQPARSEVSWAEDDESSRLGFDQPFPAATRRSFRVDDHGASADGVTDCTPAVYRALAAAKGCGQPAEVVFGPGRYLLLPHRDLGSDDLAILRASGLDNVSLRGQGFHTQLVAGDPALGCLLVSDSRNVEVRDLSIDYHPVPFTQGTVAAVDAAGSFMLALSEGYPTPADLCRAIPGGHHGYRMGRSADGTYRWPAIGGLAISAVEPGADGHWRFSAEAKALAGYLKPGDEFIFVGRRIAQMALGASFVRGLWVTHVAVHASPTCGLGLSNVDGVRIDGYADCPPPGSSRMQSTNADGIFVHGARDGITIRDCTFAAQGDDCINLHCPALAGRYVRQEGDRALVLTGAYDLRAGDVLEIMDPAQDLVRGQVVVEQAEQATSSSTETRLSLRQPLASVGYNPATDSLYPVSLSAGRFKIVGCRFGQNRSRCLLIQARNGVIAGNTGENAEGYGVILGYGGTAWAEGVIPANVTIRDNLFRNVTGVGLAGTIEAFGGKGRNLHGLTIRGNRFENPRKMVLAAQGVEGLVMEDNTVQTAAGRRNTWNHPQWYPVDCSVYLVDCGQTRIDRFTIDDPNLTGSAIHLDSRCARDGVTLGRIDARLAPDVPVVRDLR